MSVRGALLAVTAAMLLPPRRVAQDRDVDRHRRQGARARPSTSTRGPATRRPTRSSRGSATKSRKRYGVERQSRQAQGHRRGGHARRRREGGGPRRADGTVDLVWINGPNFLALKQQGLLFGPFTQRAAELRATSTRRPSAPTSSTSRFRSTACESPWRRAQIVFVYDGKRVREPPRSVRGLLAWAKRHPGRAHASDRAQLPRLDVPEAGALRARARPGGAAEARDRREFRRGRPRRCGRGTTRCARYLWRQGRQFPENGPAQRQLLNDGEIDMMISFNPAEAAVSIDAGLLPDSRAHVRLRERHDRQHELRRDSVQRGEQGRRDGRRRISCSIPRRRRTRRTSGRWATSRCSIWPSCRRRSASASTTCRESPALPTNAELGAALLEPHPSWMTRITAEWEKRYTK